MPDLYPVPVSAASVALDENTSRVKSVVPLVCNKVRFEGNGHWTLDIPVQVAPVSNAAVSVPGTIRLPYRYAKTDVFKSYFRSHLPSRVFIWLRSCMYGTNT
jgi:hypothetical protein